MTGKSYIYEVLVDGVVRYIGKGTTTRMGDHLRNARRIARLRASGEKVRTTYFYNKLVKAYLAGSTIESRITEGGLSTLDAFAREIDAICKAPKGQLWNRSSGGIGGSSEVVREQWADPEKRQRMIDALRSEGARKKQSDANKIRWADTDVRKQHGQKLRDKHSDPDWRAKWKLSMEGVWDRPGVREHASLVRKRAWTAERRAAQSEAVKKKWADKEWRAGVVANMSSAALEPSANANRKAAAIASWSKNSARKR